MSDDHDEPLQTRSRMFDELERQRQMHADIQAARLTGLPYATLAGLRENKLVAVPREPTEAMLLAAVNTPHFPEQDDPDSPDFVPFAMLRAEWAAMLAAAQDRTP